MAAALENAQTGDGALQFIDEFAAEFGPYYAAVILNSDTHRHRRSDPVQLADEHIRSRLGHECRSHLLEPPEADDNRTLTIVKAAAFLDETQWSDLAALATQLIADGVQIPSLAAKFVTTTAEYYCDRYTFHAELFKQFVSTGWEHDDQLARDHNIPVDNFAEGSAGRVVYVTRLITVTAACPSPAQGL